MDSQRFDDIARALAAKASRRQVMRSIGGSAAGGVLAFLGLARPRVGHAIGSYPSAPWAVPTTGTVGFTYIPGTHNGIDVWTGTSSASAPGSPIYATYSGTVLKLQDACGKDYPKNKDPNDPNEPLLPSRVLIEHQYPDGKTKIWSLYSHLAERVPDKDGLQQQDECGKALNGAAKGRSFILVVPGQQVDWTTQIGLQGDCCLNDNPSSITHLHFQINTASTPKADGTGTTDPTPYITGYLWGDGVPIPKETGLTYNGGGQSVPPQCGSSEKACNGRCIPKSNCCTNGDCTGSKTCKEGKCVRVTAPKITSGPTPTALTATGVTIAWTTDRPADSTVDLGVRRDALFQTIFQTDLVTNHQVVFTKLRPATTYYFRASSANDAGTATSKIGKFTTPACPSETTACGTACCGVGESCLDPTQAICVPDDLDLCLNSSIACQSAANCPAGPGVDCCFNAALATRTCTDTTCDQFNCGECGNDCPEEATCRDGICVCPNGFPACADGCCPNQTDVCIDGTCCCPNASDSCIATDGRLCCCQFPTDYCLATAGGDRLCCCPNATDACVVTATGDLICCPAGQDCSPGDPCVGVDCSGLSDPCNDGVCDAGGQCVRVPAREGASCGQNGETCQNGQCVSDASGCGRGSDCTVDTDCCTGERCDRGACSIVACENSLCEGIQNPLCTCIFGFCTTTIEGRGACIERNGTCSSVQFCGSSAECPANWVCVGGGCCPQSELGTCAPLCLQ